VGDIPRKPPVRAEHDCFSTKNGGVLKKVKIKEEKAFKTLGKGRTAE
jgi:hypothetical protein